MFRSSCRTGRCFPPTAMAVIPKVWLLIWLVVPTLQPFPSVNGRSVRWCRLISEGSGLLRSACACPGRSLLRFPSLACLEVRGNAHLCSFLPVINKYKRRRFQKTKNLLTGETEADPEMIKVTGLVFFCVVFFLPPPRLRWPNS